MFALSVQLYMQANALSFLDVLEQFRGVLRESWYGVPLYFVIFLVRPLLFIPGTLITVLGGSVFGIWPGALYAFSAGLLSSVPPYIVGRWFSDRRTTYGALERFIGLIRRNPFQAVVMMRLVYIPYDVVNVFCGVMHIPFLTYLIATGIGNMGSTASFIAIGAALQGDLSDGDFSLNPYMLVLSGVLVVVGLLFSRLAQRFQPTPVESLEETHE
jgi:uncharacterized membrane protein YdjX (TVP38/TMEM64 family)